MPYKANARELAKLGRQLRELDKVVYRGMRREMRKVGAEIADEARSSAGEWSDHIPDTVRFGVTGPMTVVIRAGNSTPTRDGGADNARPIEHAGKKGKFRHPVYGKGWTEQDARPFLNPAALAKLPLFRARITELFLGAIDRIRTGGE